VQRGRSWLHELGLGRIVAGALRDLGLDDAAAEKAARLIALLTTHQQWFHVERSGKLSASRVLEALLKDGDGQQFLGINRYQDVVWYTGEALDELLSWLFLVA